MERQIDIIIPTFEAYEHVVPCVTSVLNHMAGMNYRLILINDASRDERIDSFYLSLSGENILYLKNENNLGFVKSCNLGMKQSEFNDVLLLNTDTLVTKDWLLNLQRAVYARENIGGAIPLSNYASVYSVPELSHLDSAGIQKAGEILSAYQEKEIHEIPTAVGFCFYIKREVIRKIGFFDEIFGRGYGEENDFCMKAREAGYRFTLAANSFVYHHGHISMKAAGVLGSGESTLEVHERILNQRYPYYRGLNEKYLKSGVFEQLKQKILNRIKRGFRASQPRILFYLHHPIDGRSTGGTEFHVSDLVRSLGGIYTCYVTYIHNNRVFLEEYAGQFHSTYTYNLPCPPFFLSLRNPPLEELYQKIMRDFSIDLLHMHLTMNNSLDILYAAKSLALPIFMSIHDYYAISPDFNLLYQFKDGKWQGEREPLMEYFFAHYGVWGLDVRSWRCEMAKAFQFVNEFIFPSECALKEFRKVFWRPKGMNVIEHSAPAYCQQSPMHGWKDKPFSVCFLGYTQAPQKGYAMIKKIIPRLLHQNIPVHMLGTDARHWIEFLGKKNFHVHGAYRREEVTHRLRLIKPNVIGLVSPWHETYSYTLTESWVAGIPVIAGPLGATAERVKKHGGGVVLKDFDPAAFLNEVLRMKHHKEFYRKVVEEVNRLELKSAEESREDYRELYETYLTAASFEKKEYADKMLEKEAFRKFRSSAVANKSDRFAKFHHLFGLFRFLLRQTAGKMLYWYLDCILQKTASKEEYFSIQPIDNIRDASIIPAPKTECEIDICAE
ncbi:MAG: glycosyltransferase [Candidatus Omnitrophica bacterium]|nr:glycosyltransferase [Candidatus Omnitrophota bacterium]